MTASQRNKYTLLHVAFIVALKNYEAAKNLLKEGPECAGADVLPQKRKTRPPLKLMNGADSDDVNAAINTVTPPNDIRGMVN